jgi:DNA-binding CsgD family transcriptional regulator
MDVRDEGVGEQPDRHTGPSPLDPECGDVERGQHEQDEGDEVKHQLQTHGPTITPPRRKRNARGEAPVVDLARRRRPQPPGLSRPAKTQLAEREARAMQMVVDGFTYTEIADVLGMTRAGVITLTRRVMHRRAAEVKFNIDEARLIAMSRVEKGFAFAFALATDPDTKVGIGDRLKAHQVAQGWLDRYMKLQGLDAAPQLHVHVHDESSRQQLRDQALANLAEKTARVIEGETA